MSRTKVQRFYMWRDESISLVPLTFPFWCRRERDRDGDLSSRCRRISQPEKYQRRNKKQIVALSALKQSENIVETARERRVKLKLSNNLACICFLLDNRTESVCPGQSQVATSALISLLPYVSVGMQRVSSLRTQRVAGSCALNARRARKSMIDSSRRAPFPITGPKKGGGIYDCADVPIWGAGQGTSPANRGRSVGGQSAGRSAARW